MEPKNFNEELKNMEAEEQRRTCELGKGQMKLDDTQRVKVLSPGRLVFKRFIRNKLAIVGTAILAFMFIFCFVGALFYPYGQTQKFFKKDILENADFAAAKERLVYTPYQVDKNKTVHYSVVNMINSYISNDLKPNGKAYMFVTDETSGNIYCLEYKTESVYALSGCTAEKIGMLASKLTIGEYDTFTKEFTYSDGVNMDDGFKTAAISAVTGKVAEFTYGGKTYDIVSAGGKKYSVTYNTGTGMQYTAEAPGTDFEAAVSAAVNDGILEYKDNYYTITPEGKDAYLVNKITVNDMLYVCSQYAASLSDGISMASDEFLIDALTGLATEKTFESDSVNYVIREENGELNIYRADSNELYGILTTFSVSRVNGSGALPINFKNDIKAKIDFMIENNITKTTLITKVEKQAADGSIELDGAGNIVYEDTEVTITRKGEDYSITCDRIKYLIDVYGKPLSDATEHLHLLGTDGDGFDILARMMYGGRVSLLVGFIVVIIETLLGIIMGGISGYFGGWVDTLIMRIVDIFYCIPTLPILIILGSFFDAEQMDPYVRLMWLMAVLGFLGWAGVARMVRGQILSLREQDFMVATEVGGLRVSRRIFRHLIPNVMPQLIVTATAGLGSVIITESTLSFLGLGVKHPLATWGSMINSVSTYSGMVNYTYIWVPVGILICLTVIAFNFVGDGLRDAFDPKMKR